jgi:hypothetical protein
MLMANMVTCMSGAKQGAMRNYMYMFDNGATALSMSRKLEKDDLLSFLEKNFHCTRYFM